MKKKGNVKYFVKYTLHCLNFEMIIFLIYWIKVKCIIRLHFKWFLFTFKHL